MNFFSEGSGDESNFFATNTSETPRGKVVVEYSQVKGVEVDGIKTESHHTLNHELNHAKDYVTGTTEKEIKEISLSEARKNGEIRAVQSTNKIREKEGKPFRTQYTLPNGTFIKIPDR